MVMDRSSEKDNFHLENHASDSSWSICLSPYCVSLCRPLCQSLCFSLSVPLSLSVCLCACVCLSQNQTKIDNHLGWFWLGWLPRLVGIETTITTSNSGFKLCRDTQWTTQTTSAMSAADEKITTHSYFVIPSMALQKYKPFNSKRLSYPVAKFTQARTADDAQHPSC